MRSRRSAAASTASSSSSSSSSCSRVFAFLAFVSTALCGYFLFTWEPQDFHNIGHVHADDYMAYGPIDVVYTWVNGTDPRWKREKEYWHKHWIASLTGQPLPKKPEDTKNVKGNDVSNSDNRFRDNEELRYSLRSLEKYAPWIRHVYIVTDGQIPSWLNMENPNLHIVKHSDIFENKSHLPVFSSPAIEWNLDNIPGLSDNFLYFNDDVFLGSYVHPEDFVSQRGVQKVYFAWEVPLCSAGCWDSWLQNGRCDPQCNTTMCDFDMGDCGCEVSLNGDVSCDPVKIASIQEAAPKPPKVADHLCSGSCHYRWIGDGTCDASCNITTCGFDGGDCGNAMFQELYTASIDTNHTLVQVPVNVNATYLDLTSVFSVNGSVKVAAHDNDVLIRHATVFETEMSLLLVFGRDDDGDQMTSAAMLTVTGQDVDGEPIQLDLELVRGKKPVLNGSEIVTGTGFTTYQNTSIQPRRVRLPFGFRLAEWRTLDLPYGNAKVESETAPLEPHLEVILPFNVTGKHLKAGNVFTLAADVSLRLHDELAEQDTEWLDSHTCVLTVPDLSEPKPEKKEVTVAVDANSDAQVIESTEEPAKAEATITEEKPGVQRCELVEHGVKITLLLPTHENIEKYSSPAEESNAESPSASVEEASSSTTTSEAESSGSGRSEVSPEVDMGEEAKQTQPTRPQVTDGSICFYNQEKEEKKYCFTLSLGHFSQAIVTVAPRPEPVDPKVERAKAAKLKEVPYEPYQGDNPAFLEFTTHCMDTTRRLIGLRPLRCYRHEVPAITEPSSTDPALKNAEEGRRLACDAKRRRLQEREEQRERDAAERAQSSGFQVTVKEFFGAITGRVQRVLGVQTVEPAHEDFDDVEYEDVCRPFIEEEEKLAAERAAAITKENAEALLSKDTFGDSLRFVNRLYNRIFGKAPERRRVPSHMPFLLNRHLIREIKTRWPKEFSATSAHRFRHPQDMQFSFSYFHYLLNRHKIMPPTLDYIWNEYLDVNRNGILDENEVLTVASLANGDYPSDSFVEEVRTCLRPPKQEKVREKTTAKGTVLVAETLTPHIRFQDLERCTNITEKLTKNVRKEKQYQLMPEDEVTFHMLSDQYRYAWNQMLGTRARRTKFVCINDDMKYPSSAVSQILHELFLSIWPKRSQFELPFHLKNRYDHIDDYVIASERRQIYVYIALGVLLVAIAFFWSDLKKLFGFQDIARARAESASQLSAELQRLQDEAEAETENK
ncbi:hypothetical protein Poli38472_012929 [Pythium oligandrum]|uniref:LNR domain-containing protein n=1 Tax=Pythium oligandrum TaxID=41045 RepID=A0A8K1FLY5_PYTOL|nr:hypothetical protein Poli38472_012929 [Pythium oligandrum]|eukprot:TMW64307.1 hypothetical protein Poli38472_012929 [Pythium oligandrum]